MASKRAKPRRVTASDLRRLDGIIRRFARARVLVVGDLMLDQFIWGRVDRISPEAPVPVVQVTDESVHLGGAANVVANIRALGGRAAACGLIGADQAGKRIVAELKAIAAGSAGVITAKGVSTIRKTRIVAHNQQVVRVDREQRSPSAAASRGLLAYVSRHAKDFDAVVVSDYGKGAIDGALLGELRSLRDRYALRIIVDPKKANYAHYSGMTLATPNLAEAADAAGVEITDEHTLKQAAQRLLERWDAEAILITRGEKGMTLVQSKGRLHHFSASARQVYDVTGAGDTVAAVCALALAAGASFEDAAVLANAAAGIVVTKLGTATATPAELRKMLNGRD
jgi:D-beta-D-heptose 7-phosphate kinase/D-beta-D-heptose 1-phosphate adenosyltransferase